MSEDFYSILGVDKSASEDEIKRAYRKQAAQHHPDVSDDPDAEDKFKKLQKAKEVLTDEEKRQAYDRLGHERFEEAEKRGGFDQGGPGGPGGPFGGGGGGNPFGGGMGDIFEQFFGGGQGGQNRPRQGADLQTDLQVTLEEAFEGVQKELTVTRPQRCSTCDGRGFPPSADSETCPECNGQGQVTQVQQTPLGRVQQTQQCRRCDGAGEIHSETCSECSGDGIVHEQSTLTVDVPAGIRDGQTLRMEGEGAPGENRGPPGDLLLEVSVEEHPDFERDGANLQYRAPISFPQAVFGDSIQVPTLSGTVEMDVPSGTQSGETFRISGKGMPRLRGRGHGDLFVEVQIVTPESLNEDQREALEAFAEAGGEEIDVEEGFFDKIKQSF